MTRCRRARLPLALTLIFAALAVPAIAETAGEKPVRGGILEYAVVGPPPTTDCHGGNSFQVMHYVAPHYSLLVKFDQNRYPAVTGDLAERWSVSPDGLAYTFALHPGIAFHDGSPLTSADVKASFERLKSPAKGVVSAFQPLFVAIAAIEAPDPATVVFRLTRPVPYFLAVLANPFNCIYSAARLATDPTYPAKEVMGTGPFAFEEHVPGSHWKGRRFARYFRKDRPYLDGFRAITFAQNSAVATALQSGQVLAEFRSFTPTVRNRLSAAMGDKLTVQESTWALSSVLTFNTERPPFDDARVRRALNIAIDRWSASTNLGRIASLKPVGATQRPGSPWAASVAELEALPGFSRDMENARAEARRLLAEAGHANLKFTLTNRNVPDPFSPLAVYLIDQWRRIGVQVEHKQVDARPWQQAMLTGEFEAMIEFASALVDDPELELVKYISHDRSQLNNARYIDRELDRLYDGLATTQDDAGRRRLTRAFETRLFEQSYMFPLLWWQRTTLMSSRVRGWHITPSHIINQDLADVWLAP